MRAGYYTLAGQIMALRIALAALVVSVALEGFADMSPQDTAAVDSYRAALEAVKTSRDAGTLEATLDRLDAVRTAFLRVQDNGTTVLETLPEGDFERLERDLPGVLLNREEVVFVKPDPDYFLDLAIRHGDGADRCFFAAYKETYPDGVWPVYVRPQTDYSGCTAFGEGKLVAAYRLWTEYRRAYTHRYSARTGAEIQRVSTALTESTCACEDAAAVEKEMQQFLSAFAQSAIAGHIADRLRAVREGSSDIRPRCRSG